MSIELDKMDRRILDQLQRNGRMQNVELAREVGLSPSPCLRRVRRLEETGLLIVSLNPTSVNVQTIIMGNILGIADEDMLQVEIIIAVSFLVLMFIWKDLLVVFFDETHARSIGLNPLALKIIFFTLLSACTVAALQTVGAILVIAMVITPGATAYLLTDQFKKLLIIAVVLGAVTSSARLHCGQQSL